MTPDALPAFAQDYLSRYAAVWPYVQPFWDQPTIRWGLIMVLAAVVLAVAWGPRSNTQQRVGKTTVADKDIRRAKNTAWWRRQCWKLRPPCDVMCADGLVIDRTGKRSHALWPGPTGVGKSESVATVRCDGARPWLAVMPDVSDPLRRRADFIWTAGESQRPIDFLKGTPEDVAERLTTVFRSGGNGVWMMAAREAATQVIRGLDQDHKPRSLQAIGAGIEELVETNRRLKMACEGWITRFMSTAMAMGPSVAAGGVDIGDLLRAGKGVVIDNDRWKHPGLCGDTVAFGLAEAKRIGDLVPGGFRLIFEEADQLGERIDLADPFFAAGRRRLIAVDALVHAEEDADDAMATNSATRVYFRPNKPEQRAKVAKALDLSESEVDAIPDYHAWIEHDGKIRRLVHFPKPKAATTTTAPVLSAPGAAATAPIEAVRTNAGANAGEWDEDEDAEVPMSEAEALLHLLKHQPQRIGPIPTPEWITGKRLRPEQRDRQRLQEIWAEHVFPYGVDGCYETTYSTNLEGANGRPRCGYMGQPWLVYALLLAVHDGLDLDVVKEEMKARKRSADHKCENNRCVRIEHLQWKNSTGANSAAYHERRRETLRLLTG